MRSTFTGRGLFPWSASRRKSPQKRPFRGLCVCSAALDQAFIDFEEGRALFPERPTWQEPANYPALRVLPDVDWIPCRFYDKTAGACTVYDIRPAMRQELPL